VPVVVVVSGPSGVGKSTVVNRVLEARENISISVSLTTRPPRRGEVDGVDYHFVTSEEFLRRRESGDLLEWAEVHGNLYGTRADFVENTIGGGTNVLLEIDVQGGMSVKKKKPESVLIFLLPPSFEALEARLRGRGTDSEEVIERRIRNARWELGFYDKYDYLVINDDIDRCIGDVLAVIDAEALRRTRADVDITS
jgi:guanylate kinase